MRRQATTGQAVGSSRGERLDPFALPLRFVDDDFAADEHVRQVELYHDRIVLRRALGGIKMALNLPVATYQGVAIRMEPATAAAAAAVAIVLEHHDPALSITLYRTRENTDLVADWHSWARALGVPLLIAQKEGNGHEPFLRLGNVSVGGPAPRRRRRSSVRGRRASIPLRRGRGSVSRAAKVHAGEREIIARN